jgi:ATP-dependent exoDNAse (exonuclease V) beta subunit
VYTILGKKDHTSVTTWIKQFFGKFNADQIIDRMMKSSKWPESKYYGKTKEEIKEDWNQNGQAAARLGTEMHKMFENYYNGLPLEETSIETSIEYSYFQKFIADHSHMKPYRSEWTVYDEDLKLSGSIDMTFINEDGTLSIYDWKRCKSIEKVTMYRQYAKAPIKHIPDTNFWHYTLQLNAYKMILERKYGFVVKDMFLICIHPELDSTYQKHEVEAMDMAPLIKQ